jgi:SAM-dependent methyltransferase
VGGGERRAARTGPGQLTVRTFRPNGQDDLAPSGTVARIRANLTALTTLRAIQRENRPARPDEQAVLARWSGWGATPEVFDPERRAHAWARDELSRLLTPAELSAAARNTLNAHYTDADLVRAIWAGVQQLGFTGGRVLEPGCGSGNFIGFAPGGVRFTGVELEPVTAQIAAALYPDADIACESFASFRTSENSFDLIGNVPFGSFALTDRVHNPGGHSIHNHFIIKALHLVRPGGLVAVVTSRYTLDARNPAARREIAALADLAGAVRLPSRAHQRAAGTAVVTDLLMFRRREPGREPDGTGWEQTRMAELDGVHVPVNEYFLDHPDAVLGELRAVHGAHNAEDLVVAASGDTGAALARALTRAAADAASRGLTWAAPAHAEAPAMPAAPRSRQPDGYLDAHRDGTFTQVIDGHAVPFPVLAARDRVARLEEKLRERAAPSRRNSDDWLAEAAMHDMGAMAGIPGAALNGSGHQKSQPQSAAQVSRHAFPLDNPLAGATPGSGQVASKPGTQAHRAVRHVG